MCVGGGGGWGLTESAHGMSISPKLTVIDLWEYNFYRLIVRQLSASDLRSFLPNVFYVAILE